MSEIYKFFNSAPGDPRFHQASDFADYFGSVLSSGLLHINNMPSLQVLCAGTDLRTYIEPGRAIIQGYNYENTTDLYLQHSLPEQGIDRIDRIVLRLDKRNKSRFIKLFVKEGESSDNPIPPELQRDDLVYELSLAQIRVRANTASLDSLDLIDERMNENLCGIVFSLISVPTSVFQQQFDMWLSGKKNQFNNDMESMIGDFAQFIEQSQTELNIWSDMNKSEVTNWQEGRKSEIVVFKNEYITWTAEQKADFENWQKGRKSEITTFKNEYTTNLNNWVTERKKNFENWEGTEQLDFRAWQSQERNAFFNWFNNLQYVLDGDVAGHLQNQIDRALPTVDITTITHNLNYYPRVTVLKVTYGAGMNGAGVGPAGEDTVVMQPKISYVDRSKVKITLPMEYLQMGDAIVSMLDDKYLIMFENDQVTSLLVTIHKEG